MREGIEDFGVSAGQRICVVLAVPNFPNLQIRHSFEQGEQCLLDAAIDRVEIDDDVLGLVDEVSQNQVDS